MIVEPIWGMVRISGKNDAVYQAVLDCDKVLALDLDKAPSEPETAAPDVSADPEADAIEEQIALRAAAKKAKNYAEADRIRGELAAKGIVLIDSKDGTTWKRG